MNENFINPIDALFDEENDDLIVLYNEREEPMPFEQIAVVPLPGAVYAILKPAEPMEGVGEDEAFVFLVETGEEESLTLVDDDDVIDQVFNIYNALIEDELEEGEQED